MQGGPPARLGAHQPCSSRPHTIAPLTRRAAGALLQQEGAAVEHHVRRVGQREAQAHIAAAGGVQACRVHAGGRAGGRLGGWHASQPDAELDRDIPRMQVQLQ